jgi:hypothetical protein
LQIRRNAGPEAVRAHEGLGEPLAKITRADAKIGPAGGFGLTSPFRAQTVTAITAGKFAVFQDGDIDYGASQNCSPGLRRAGGFIWSAPPRKGSRRPVVIDEPLKYTLRFRDAGGNSSDCGRSDALGVWDLVNASRNHLLAGLVLVSGVVCVIPTVAAQQYTPNYAPRREQSLT